MSVTDPHYTSKSYLIMNIEMNQNINVGVYTGKLQLDIYIHPLDIYFTVTNDEKDIKEAIILIKKHQPEQGSVVRFDIVNLNMKRYSRSISKRYRKQPQGHDFSSYTNFFKSVHDFPSFV
jgi:hypothetical protein